MKENKIPNPLFKFEEQQLLLDAPKFIKPKQAIIIGGGYSKVEGINKGLWNKIENKFVCCTNYDYINFNATFVTFVDYDFYKNELKNLKKLPLIIGKDSKNLEKIKHLNTILIQSNDSEYTRNLSKGVYKSLCGVYSLSLMIYLLNIGEIFLCGFDNGSIKGAKDKKNRPLTHSYQGKIEHRGIGRLSYYNVSDREKTDFGVYFNEKQCKIYNVSPDSNIKCFTKITYEQFFNKLDNKSFDQFNLRKWIKEKLARIV